MIEALDRQKFGGRAEAMRQQETDDVVSRSICCSAMHHGESKDDNGSTAVLPGSRVNFHAQFSFHDITAFSFCCYMLNL